MKDLKVWMRLGDQGDYESFDTPFEAGENLGQCLNEDYAPEYRYRDMGVEIDSFTGDNYISLFWGDDDAQPVDESSLNTSDRLDFEAGVSNAERVF